MQKIVILGSDEMVVFHPTNAGFAYGCGLFETIKLAGGRLYFWPAHWRRLQGAAHTLGIECHCNETAVLAAIRELVRTESVVNGTIKLSLFADKLYVYSRPPLSVADGPLRLKVDLESRINEHSHLAGHKTHNYMENFLLLQECRRQGYHDVLRMNTSGSLAETAVGNVFFIHAGQLCTPSEGVGILPGIMRATVLEMARSERMDTNAGVFSLDALKSAEAMFVTNVSGGILPVFQVCSREILFEKDSESHPTVKRLSVLLARVEEKDSIAL